MSENSVVMVLLHVVFGRPLLRFPVGVHLRATFGIESCGIRRTWPNHLNLCFCIWVLIGDEFDLLYRSSLDILFGQNILQVLLRHLVWNTSSLFISSLGHSSSFDIHIVILIDVTVEESKFCLQAIYV